MSDLKLQTPNPVSWLFSPSQMCSAFVCVWISVKKKKKGLYFIESGAGYKLFIKAAVSNESQKCALDLWSKNLNHIIQAHLLKLFITSTSSELIVPD